MHIMDAQRVTKSRTNRRRHSDAFKQAVVERSLVPGASVAAIAQDTGINANLLFNWRRLHLQSLASAAAKDSRGP
jgi:transposase